MFPYLDLGCDGVGGDELDGEEESQDGGKQCVELHDVTGGSDVGMSQ